MRRVAWFVSLAMLGGIASAEDLVTVFERARVADPLIREADANRKATQESRPQALAALLPQISGTAGYQKSETEGPSEFANRITGGPAAGTVQVTSQSGTREPETKTWSVDLRQNVFSWPNWVLLKRANREVAQAEADYAAAEQDLVLRVSTAYFEALAARDNLEAQNVNLESVSRQLEQSDKRFEVGLIAITDVQEARAARDAAAADVIAAKRALASAEEALREITGQKYTELRKPGDDLPLLTPSPASEDQWVQSSMDQNLALVSSRLAADIARDDVRAAFGNHLPTLDIVASRGNTRTTTDQAFPPEPPLFPNPQSVTLDSDLDQTVYGLQFSLPIFSGGLTQSRVRQQEFRWQAARERLEATSRATERQARDAYLGVTSEISRVNALKQALASSQTALRATEAGYEVGTRTTVDVLAARRTAVQAFTNLSRSKYDYIINTLRLRQAVGSLDVGTLQEVNGWLNESVGTTQRSTTSPDPGITTTPGSAPSPSPLPPPAQTPPATTPTPSP